MKTKTPYLIVVVLIIASGIVVYWRQQATSSAPTTAPSNPPCLSDGKPELIRNVQIPPDALTRYGSQDIVSEGKNCGVYVVRPDAEEILYLWRYTYDGKSEKTPLYTGERANDVDRSYMRNFKVDDSEKYIALMKESEGLNFISIRDLKTGEELKNVNFAGFRPEYYWAGDVLHFNGLEGVRPRKPGPSGEVDTKTWTVKWSDE